MRVLILSVAVLAGLTCGSAQSAEPGEVVSYRAEYEVRYKGRRVARAEFSVAAEADGQFVFNSSTKARGIWRLASPNPAIEWSRFRTDAGRIVPTSFRYEDGSRQGEDNYSVEFDESSGEIRINGPSGQSTLPYDSDLLDRGSLQVALMLDLAACELPGPFRYVDEDGVREYRYERLEDLATETEIGMLDTIRFSQQREGSSRNTIIWTAPSLAYLPVRIEQIRDGEVETVFSIESLSGLTSAAPGCSSLG